MEDMAAEIAAEMVAGATDIDILKIRIQKEYNNRCLLFRIMIIFD